MKLFPDKSVDSVFVLDVIEHFGKDEGLAFLAQAERIARRQIMVFTPLDFYPQSYDEVSNLDRWGMHGGYWQAHRSGWLPEDFGDDWDLVCCDAYHLIDEHDRRLEKPFGAIWAFRNLDDQTGRRNDKRSARSDVTPYNRSLEFLRKVHRRLRARL